MFFSTGFQGLVALQSEGVAMERQEDLDRAKL